ncbi:MAG: diacylglycerol/lipid kinase family protein [Floccifex sp.]
MKYVFIVNPNSRKEGLYTLMEQIKKYFKGKTVIIEKTQSMNHACHIAKKYAFKEEEDIHMFACGGDGTLHEVVNGIAGCKHITLSIIPIGTGNDFIKYFDHLDREDFLNFEYYQNPDIVSCDLLKVNGEYVINTVSFGFDVHVARHVNDFRKKLPLRGILPYYLGMLSSLRHPISSEFDIQIDCDKIQEHIFSFVVITNGRYYGGGYKPCPGALINDHMLDICLIKDIKRTQIVQLAKIYEKGEHLNYPELAYVTKGNIVSLYTNNQGIYGNLDGEIRLLKNPTIEVEENKIRLCIPRKK